MEIYHVNNWVFTRPNIFQLSTPKNTSQNFKAPKALTQAPSFNNVLEKQKRVIASVAGQVKCVDTLDTQIYVIYKQPATVVDVIGLSGRNVARIDVAKVIAAKLSSNIKLRKLDFILVPVLKWTGRRNKLLQSFGKVRQSIDAPKVVLVGQATTELDNWSTPVTCLIVLNLVS